MYPGSFFPGPLPMGPTLHLHKLDEFLSYLKNHRIKEVFWHVIKTRIPEVNTGYGPPMSFKPEVYFLLKLAARHKELTVLCDCKLPVVFAASEVESVKSEAEKIRRSVKRRGFLLHEGSLGFSVWPYDDVWDVEEMLNQTPESNK
jgi:hypothetical protein